MTSSRPCRRATLSVAAVLLLAPSLPAQRVAPPPPAQYDVQARYSIRAARNQRIQQFFEMVRYLDGIGFQRVPGEEDEPADPAADRLRGTLPANKVREFLLEPHVRTLLLVPAGLTLPANAEQPVLVQLRLSAVGGNRQEDLAAQAVARLRGLGFVPKVGFDHEGNTRLLGTIPAGRLTALLPDLRGTFEEADKLPEPIRSELPVRIAEVLPEPEGVPASADVPPPPAPPPGQEYLEKLSPELRAAEGDAPTRLEVILTRDPAATATAWRDALLEFPGVAVEGRLGAVVSIRAPIGLARTLAVSPDVAGVRLARAATRTSPPGLASTPADVLTGTHLDRLHRLGYRGRGVRVAIIDGDFAGWQPGADKLSTYIDLTATRNASLLPDPAEAGMGRGTLAARAVRLAAPEAELVLIRVDPAAAYMVLDAARYVHGETFRTESMTFRHRELTFENDRLRVQAARLTEERRLAMEDFREDEEAQKRREATAAALADHTRQEREYANRLQRFFKLEDDLLRLREVRVVVCPLAWDVGYPADGTGALSRYLDETFAATPQPRKPTGPKTPSIPAVWLQAAGDTRGQVWAGKFLDADGNGIMEFAPAGMPLPVGRWTPELNFLAWQPLSGGRAAALPAGGRLRVALQWTEAHDSTVTIGPDGSDPYRAPLADLRLLALRQRDATGRGVATDDFNVAARSARLPQLIRRSDNAATYEHVVEFPLEAAAGIALRIEGHVPTTTRPASFPTLPSQERTWELTARVFVEVIDASGQGRPVFGDFAPYFGGLGMPGDAAAAVTVGGAAARGVPRPYSAAGSPPGRELLGKPSFLAYDHLPISGATGGTAQATALAGGLLASMMSAGVPESHGLGWLGLSRDDLLVVPPAWLDQLDRRWLIHRR